MMPFLGPWSPCWHCCSPSAESDRRFGLVLALFMCGGSAEGDEDGPNSVTSAAECLWQNGLWWFIQRSAIVNAPGFVNCVPAVAYHFCLNLPAAFTQPGASALADLCIWCFLIFYLWPLPCLLIHTIYPTCFAFLCLLLRIPLHLTSVKYHVSPKG